MTAGCHYEERWTLTAGLNVFDMGQEYKEWRWAELLELPAPIALADVGAWVVHYPLDDEKNTTALAEPAAPPNPRDPRDPRDTFDAFTGRNAFAEGGVDAAAAPTPPGTPAVPYGDTDAITAFASSDAKLNAVWELGRWTILTTSLDVNTDSNTRYPGPPPSPSSSFPLSRGGGVSATGWLVMTSSVAVPMLRSALLAHAAQFHLLRLMHFSSHFFQNEVKEEREIGASDSRGT